MDLRWGFPRPELFSATLLDGPTRVAVVVGDNESCQVQPLDYAAGQYSISTRISHTTNSTSSLVVSGGDDFSEVYSLDGVFTAPISGLEYTRLKLLEEMGPPPGMGECAKLPNEPKNKQLAPYVDRSEWDAQGIQEIIPDFESIVAPEIHMMRGEEVEAWLRISEKLKDVHIPELSFHSTTLTETLSIFQEKVNSLAGLNLDTAVGANNYVPYKVTLKLRGINAYQALEIIAYYVDTGFTMQDNVLVAVPREHYGFIKERSYAVNSDAAACLTRLPKQFPSEYPLGTFAFDEKNKRLLYRDQGYRADVVAETLAKVGVIDKREWPPLDR
jgi:hypothetical protein